MPMGKEFVSTRRSSRDEILCTYIGRSWSNYLVVEFVRCLNRPFQNALFRVVIRHSSFQRDLTALISVLVSESKAQVLLAELFFQVLSLFLIFRISDLLFLNGPIKEIISHVKINIYTKYYIFTVCLEGRPWIPPYRQKSTLIPPIHQ